MAKSLSEHPEINERDPNKWADYWEIRCIASIEKQFRRDDILNLIQDSSIGTSGDDGSTDAIYSGNNAGEKTDEIRSKIDDWYNIVQSRASLFGSSYPFNIDEFGISLKSRRVQSRNLYLVLLLSSNLDYAQNFMSDLTDWFEVFSAGITKKMYPTNKFAQIYKFGKGKNLTNNRYSGTVLEKLKKLKTDLHLEFTKTFDADCNQPGFISKYSTGDYGLDIVAWLDYGDNESMSPFLFGQCACGQNWENKQFEAHHTVWQNIFEFHNPPQTALYIPRSWRRTDGKFRFFC